MSGAFGWVNNNVHIGTRVGGGGFTKALDAYQTPAPHSRTQAPPRTPSPAPSRTTTPPPAPARPSMGRLPVPTARHTLKSTAANVLIVVQDMTGSMGAWRDEILDRNARLFHFATAYLGTDDLDVLFIAHGDVRGDTYPIQVTQFAAGPALDQHLASFERCGGGGQGTESHELVATYLVRQVDTSSARNVYCFFVTDEAGCDTVQSAAVEQHLGLHVDAALQQTPVVFDRLRQRMHTYVVLCETGSYNPVPIRAWWEQTLDREHVLPLDDARRVVDAMLGVIAVHAGQLDQFTRDLEHAQAGKRYGKQNVDTVLKSIALVGKGTPSDPYQVPGGNAPPALLSTLQGRLGSGRK